MDFFSKQIQQLSIMICVCAVVIAGAIAAWFEYRDRGQTEEERKKTQIYYGRKWQKIKDSGILNLAHEVIIWILKLRHALVHKYEQLVLRVSYRIHNGFILVAPIFGFFVGWINLNLVAGIFSGIIFISVFTLEYYQRKLGKYPIWKQSKILTTIGIITIVVWILVGIGWVKILIARSTTIALVGMVASFPFLVWLFTGSLWGIGVALYSKPTSGKTIDRLGGENILFIGFTIAFSFIVTLSAFLVGSYIGPNSLNPQNMQMLLSNVVCDGFTMFFTILILSLAVAPQSKFPIGIAVLIDLFLAALLACISLYLGLLGSENSITFRQTMNVLIALSPDGSSWEIGPCFWAMHTTFLPTLAYLSMVFLCWVARLFVLPVSDIFYRGAAVEKPHQVTIGFLLFIGAVFTALAAIIAFIPVQEVAEL